MFGLDYMFVVSIALVVIAICVVVAVKAMIKVVRRSRRRHANRAARFDRKLRDIETEVRPIVEEDLKLWFIRESFMRQFDPDEARALYENLVRLICHVLVADRKKSLTQKKGTSWAAVVYHDHVDELDQMREYLKRRGIKPENYKA